jgi:acylphosphatase
MATFAAAGRSTCFWARGEDVIMAETVARLVHYSGRVQGVGFRVTAVRIARRYPVTGWVRNLPDGRVQMLAEGEAGAVEAFLQAVRDFWRRDIGDEQREERPASGTHSGFEVVR